MKYISSVILLFISCTLSARIATEHTGAVDTMYVSDLRHELAWLDIEAVEMAYNDMKKEKSFNASMYSQKLYDLKQLVASGFSGIEVNDPAAIGKAEKALGLKREILLANPLLDIDKIIVGLYKLGENARSATAVSLGTQKNNWTNQISAPKEGFDAEIVLLHNLRGEIESQKIFKPHNGSSVPDLKLHWDADRILFSMTDSTKRWQIFEIGVDGTDLKQLTRIDEPDLEFFDGAYLPDGKIIAISNIGYNAVPCVDGNAAVGNTCLYDPETGALRRLTFDQDANWGPVIMHNGRVMYTRWEYTDLTHYFSRMVMHMNPDGTEQKALYGSGSVFPNSTFDIQPIPNHATRFIGIISGHHGTVRSGRLIIFDPSKNRKGEKGMVQELPFSNRPIIPIVKDRLVDGVWPQFLKPYPLNDKYFLVTAKLSPESLWGLYLVDVFDNLTLLKSAEGEGFINAIPLKKQPVPPVIPDKTKQDKKTATVFIQDIYEGEGLKGVPRGTVKAFRVMAYEYAYNKVKSDFDGQGIQSGWDIKRLLGVVPVEEDGSAIFTIPANTPISLQPLDANGCAVQWMRSWLTGMPGEIVSCVGCHEDQNQIPIPKRVIASTRTPHAIVLPEGGIRSITFDLEIQPILDRACVACHNSGSKLDYTGGRIDTLTTFGKSYLNFHPYVRRQGPEAGMKVLYPYEYHANTSPIIQMLRTGHHGVKLTDKEWKTLYNWIDFNAPYHGTMRSSVFNGFEQVARRIELTDKYANGMGVDWKKELEDYAAYLRTQPVKVPIKPEEKEVVFKNVKVKGFPFCAQTARDMIKGKENIRIIELAPGITLKFVRIPAGKFIMGKNRIDSSSSPAHKAEIKKEFWMCETEITNEQLRALIPEHESRFIDQQWKDHVNEGYPADLPELPAIRTSYELAMAFCKKATEQTGLKITLPSETEWEWACRAGSAADFWYGTLKDDFSRYENMADQALNLLAVRGVDPQPMSPSDPMYPYYTYHPKNNHVDDGNMIICKGKQYQPNPWGLYDMHGNVAEWTRSDYLPYDSDGNQPATMKVLRGGSYIDHPKFSTASSRRGYLPWQRVFNAGFRVIIEE